MKDAQKEILFSNLCTMSRWFAPVSAKPIVKSAAAMATAVDLYLAQKMANLFSEAQLVGGYQVVLQAKPSPFSLE